MPITYTNRKEKTYTLCKSTTKRGQTRYYFSPEPNGEVLDEIPQGYETKESVNGVVSLVKIHPHQIHPDELSVVEKALSKHPQARNFRIDVKGKQIIIYENMGMDVDALIGIFQQVMPIPKSRADALRAKQEQLARFGPVLRFVLDDPRTRTFHAACMGFTGKGGWRYPVRWGTIEELTDEIIPLLGSDELFELW